MFIEMILKAIPRSVPAAVALVITLIALPYGFNNLGQIFVGQATPMQALLGLGALAIGSITGVIFYILQSLAEQDNKHRSLETIRSYYKDRSEEDRLRNAKVSVQSFPGEGRAPHKQSKQ